jgi:hypothetical protein
MRYEQNLIPHFLEYYFPKWAFTLERRLEDILTSLESLSDREKYIYEIREIFSIDGRHGRLASWNRRPCVGGSPE